MPDLDDPTAINRSEPRQLRSPTPVESADRCVRSSGFAMNHGLGLEEVAERNLSPFPSISGHLISAKRRLRIFAGSIDINHAGLDPGGDLGSTILAGRLHIGCEAIHRVVCDLDGFLDVAI